MATTTAAITITSSDIGDNAISISNTATLTTAGTNTGLVETTGLARKKFASSSNIILLDHGLTSGIAADVTADKSAKLYIKNVGTDSSTYFTIGKGNSSGSGTETTIASNGTAYYRIGRLYGQDWMLIPWDAASTTGDITIQASSASSAAPMHVEYIVFYE